MRNPIHGVRALPVAQAGRHPDLLLAAFVVALVAVLTFPVPAALLDGLLAANIVAAVVVLLSVLLSDRALALSTFPSILLLSTLFRLVLNVSTTRMILGTGAGGDVVATFGRIVVGHDIVVGLVVFGVISLVQFLVIAKGAERVAEVGARFALDAMPGHQMSIDAQARAGAITEAEAQRQREELGRLSQFHGAMDGAMKFVKGDAIVGLLITALNLVVGFLVGVLVHGLTSAEAARTYALLSVGDGLVSQVPALLVALAAALLTTRVSSRDRRDLASTLQAELLGRPKVLAVAATASLGAALMPGLPVAPFLLIACGLAAGAAQQRWSWWRSAGARTGSGVASTLAATPESARRPIRKTDDRPVNMVAPIGIDLEPSLSQALGFSADGRDDGSTELIGELIPELREVVFEEVGVRLPAVRVRTFVGGLSAQSFAIRINEVPVAEGRIDPGALLVSEDARALRDLGVDATEVAHPWGVGPAALVAPECEPLVESLGHTVWSPGGQVALHLARVARSHAAEFVGLEETDEMLRALEKVYPSVVREAVPKLVDVPQLTQILKRLVDERVSIRDLRSILEALVEVGDRAHDTVGRTELVRAKLGAQIAHAHAGLGRALAAVLLEPAIEDALVDAVVDRPAGSYLSLTPHGQSALVASIARMLSPAHAAGIRPVVLTRAEIRRYLRKVIEHELGDVPVLSVDELPPQLSVHPLGRVILPEGIELHP